jgi:hypothetical protein
MKGVIPLEIACAQEKAMKIVSLQLWKRLKPLDHFVLHEKYEKKT